MAIGSADRSSPRQVAFVLATGQRQAKFHVLQYAAAALDEVRRQEFFRAGA